MSPLSLSLALSLICAISLVVADYDEESDEESDEYQGRASSDESDELEEEVALTRSNCVNALVSPKLGQMCCHEHLHLDKASLYCSQHEDLSNLDFSTEKSRGRAIMRLVQCFFRRKKYIKSQNRVNMKRVKADAAQLDSPAETKFLLNMYRTCEEQGHEVLHMYSEYPHDMVGDVQSPHEIFVYTVYACVNNYFVEIECPYFHWFSEEGEVHDKCASYASECRKLVA